MSARTKAATRGFVCGHRLIAPEGVMGGFQAVGERAWGIGDDAPARSAGGVLQGRCEGRWPLLHRNVHELCNSNTWNLDQRDEAEHTER